jgi:putative pantetheine hydrolase
MPAGPRDDLTDVAGVRVGHHHRTGRGWLTGTTVVVPPPGTTAGVDVRGGAPGTRETDLLRPEDLVEHVDAICLGGGSAYGLAAATGVVELLGERHRGFPVGPEPHHVVPIVPAAVVFDLGRGGPASFTHRPDAAFGRRAAAAALAPRTPAPVTQGNAGAGAGAKVGLLKGGIGSASTVLDGGTTVAALVVLNAAGSPVHPATGELHGARALPGALPAGWRRPSAADARAWRARLDGALAPAQPLNTTLVVVATDATLDKAGCTRLAGSAHDGLARAVQPAHLLTDGDTAFALATGARPLVDGDGATPAPTAPTPATPGVGGELRARRTLALNTLCIAAADVVVAAVVHAVLAATSAGGFPSYAEVFPSARPRVRPGP